MFDHETYSPRGSMVPPERNLPATSRYRLVKYLATGGMGTVYLGMLRGAEGFSRPVAIKRAHGHLLEDPAIRRGILEEARLGAFVTHPNVVRIEDVEEIDGELILVMSYVDGATIAQLAGSGRPMPCGVALRIILDACSGLHAIHVARDGGRPLQLVHRDISPQNILVGTDGVSRIADFGVAKGRGDGPHTEPTMRQGKWGYMAPEYIKMRVSEPGSDVFALGIVLWEMLAGRRLFDGESGLESLRLAAAAVVPTLLGVNLAVSRALDAVVKKALARSPFDRYGSARELSEALVQATHGKIATAEDVASFVVAARNDNTASVVITLDPEDMVDAPPSLVNGAPLSVRSADVEVLQTPGIVEAAKAIEAEVVDSGWDEGTSDVLTSEVELSPLSDATCDVNVSDVELVSIAPRAIAAKVNAHRPARLGDTVFAPSPMRVRRVAARKA